MTIGPDASKGACIISLDEDGKYLDYLTSNSYNKLDTIEIYIISM